MLFCFQDHLTLPDRSPKAWYQGDQEGRGSGQGETMPPETIIHLNTVAPSEACEPEFIRACLWILAGMVLVGFGMTIHGHSGPLLARLW